WKVSFKSIPSIILQNTRTVSQDGFIMKEFYVD
ncbi:uncharacterized protein METZ01_LOCUS232058, partial [marine metagenome]